MSGPATASFSFAPLGAITLAALAVREAQAMGREYLDVLADVKARAEALANARAASQQARMEERRVLRSRAAQAQSRLERLRGLLAGVQDAAGTRYVAGFSGELPTLADLPSEGWRRHIDAADAEAARIQDFIREHAAPLQELPSSADLHDDAPVSEALHVYMMHRAMQGQLDPQQSKAIRHIVERILSRLDLADGAGVPLEVDELARSIALAPDLARAEALAMELRLQVQRLNARRASQCRGVEEARSLLAALADDVPPELAALLEEVVSGEREMDAPLRELAQAALTTLEAQRKRLQEEAASQVLEQSLRDLGYEVDGVENTFFVEGGVAHFQRPGWGEYFVRMRVGAEDNTMNFNVVRARGAAQSEERKRIDTMAEDRWCSEFPKLLETLKARGIMLNVTRLLGAGELPVQVVDAATLPAAASADRRRATAQLQAVKRP